MPQIPHEPFWSATIGADEHHCVDVMLQGDILQIGITNGAAKGVKITLTDSQLDTLIRTLKAVQDKIHQHRAYVQQNEKSELLIPGQNPPNAPGTRYDPTQT